MRRGLVRDPERRVTDSELRDDVGILVRAAYSVDLDRSKRCPVELNGCTAAPHRELRHDADAGRMLRPIVHRQEREPRCQTPTTFPAGSRNVATHKSPSGYGSVTTSPAFETTVRSVSSTRST